LSDRDLIFKSAALARSSPQEWSEFLGALRAYTDTIRNQCISSPLDVLPVAQGRAQNCVALLGIFEGCVRAADQIQEKRK
jgi:hypothetical protein